MRTGGEVFAGMAQYESGKNSRENKNRREIGLLGLASHPNLTLLAYRHGGGVFVRDCYGKGV